MADDEPDWRRYERQIHDSLKELGGPDSTVEFDKTMPGRFSGEMRQVDVFVAGKFAGEIEQLDAAVDCKCLNRKVHLKDVEAFMGLVEDVDTDLGILVTNEGASAGAKRRLKKRGFRIHIVALEDLDEIWEELIPKWEPPEEEQEPAVYIGDSYDHEPYGEAGCSVVYTGPDDYGSVLVGPDVWWGDEKSRTEVVTAIMRHHLGKDPDPEAVDSFLVEFGERLKDGYPFELEASDVAHMAY